MKAVNSLYSIINIYISFFNNTNYNVYLQDVLGTFYRSSYVIKDKVIMKQRQYLSELAKIYFYLLIKLGF